MTLLTYAKCTLNLFPPVQVHYVEKTTCKCNYISPFDILWNYDKEIIKDALGISSFILVHIRHHFKPCAFGRVKCHVQMLCNSMREGPDGYFVNIGDAFGENK